MNQDEKDAVVRKQKKITRLQELQMQFDKKRSSVASQKERHEKLLNRESALKAKGNIAKKERRYLAAKNELEQIDLVLMQIADEIQHYS